MQLWSTPKIDIDSDKLHLQLPLGSSSKKADIKPSSDIYVMLAISLAAALYTPESIADGAPIVHFHGYMPAG